MTDMMTDIHDVTLRHLTECDICYNYIAEFIIKEQTARAGKTKSKAKSKASRINGKLGGRPRKK